jgi:hypothetical protein
VHDSAGLPDYTTELGFWPDRSGTNGAKTSGVVTHAATDVVSLTAVIWDDGGSGDRQIAYHEQGAGQGYYVLGLKTAKYYAAVVNGGTHSVSVGTVDEFAWVCVTYVVRGGLADGLDIFVNGTDLSAVLDTTGAPDFQPKGILNLPRPTTLGVYGLARARIDDDALSLADHRTLCGDLFQAPAGGPDDNKPLAADDSWTQTGGARCYPIGTTAAICPPGGLIPYTVDATGLGWVVEESRTNRILYSGSNQLDCTNWTCSTATIAASVSPEGSLGAANITMSGGYVEQTATGYTASTALYGGIWAKCSSGTLSIRHLGNNGDWDVACSTVGGSWALIRPGHAALTINTAFQSDSSGNLTLRISGADAEIWVPTWTEEPGSGLSVIPTKASSVSTGDPVWAIDNTAGDYHHTGDTVTQSLSTIDGACWAVSGTDLLLSGSSTCSGVWYDLEVGP